MSEEEQVEDDANKKASKRVVATWHPYGTAPDGAYLRSHLIMCSHFSILCDVSRSGAHVSITLIDRDYVHCSDYQVFLRSSYHA